jgi:hypothetical protein
MNYFLKQKKFSSRAQLPVLEKNSKFTKEIIIVIFKKQG